MINVYLLQQYKGHSSSSIIEVNHIEADELIAAGVARLTLVRDYLVKPEFGVGKAFKSPPKGR